MKKIIASLLGTSMLALVLSLGACSSKKQEPTQDVAAADATAMQATPVATNDVSLGATSTGRSR